jgi:hypothetical protein
VTQFNAAGGEVPRRPENRISESARALSGYRLLDELESCRGVPIIAPPAIRFEGEFSTAKFVMMGPRVRMPLAKLRSHLILRQSLLAFGLDLKSESGRGTTAEPHPKALAGVIPVSVTAMG